MNKLPLMRKDVPTVSIEDSVSKAINLMYINSVKQIPVVNIHDGYDGIIYYKDFINSAFQSSSKIKHFLSQSTYILTPDDDLQCCINYMIATGKTALPVVDKGKFIGIVVDKDLISEINANDLKVNELMSYPVTIDEKSNLDEALAIMRKNNISRLPVVNSTWSLIGIISLLDVLKILSIPQEKNYQIFGSKEKLKAEHIHIKEILRVTAPIENDTLLKNSIDIFKNYDELVITSQNKPIGIITPKDILELSFSQQSNSIVYVTNFGDGYIKKEVIQKMQKFLNKMGGKITDGIKYVIIYVEKLGNFCSIRIRIITSRRVIHSHSNDYDILKTFKSVLEKLEKQIMELQSKNTN